jgi:hypothetical protein
VCIYQLVIDSVAKSKARCTNLLPRALSATAVVVTSTKAVRLRRRSRELLHRGRQGTLTLFGHGMYLRTSS